MSNRRLHIEDFIEEVRTLDPNPIFRQGIVSHKVFTYFGKPVFYDGSDVVLFERCGYCGTTNKPQKGLFDILVCVQCGATI